MLRRLGQQKKNRAHAGEQCEDGKTQLVVAGKVRGDARHHGAADLADDDDHGRDADDPDRPGDRRGNF